MIIQSPVTFTEVEKVFVKNFRQGKACAPVSFEINLENGWTSHRHRDHIPESLMCEAVEESPEETDNMHFPIVRGDTKLTTSPAELSDDGLTEQQQQTADNAMAFTQMAGVDRVVREKTL